MLSKDQKKKLMREWKQQQMKKRVLNKLQVNRMIAYVEDQLEKQSCNGTLRFTKEWLNKNLSQDQHEVVIKELEEMGGYCDCEVIANCYEEYLE